MSLIDDLNDGFAEFGRMAREGGRRIADGVNQFAEETKLNSQIRDQERSQAKAFEQLGRIYYEKLQQGTPDETEQPIVDEIRRSMDEANALKEKLAALKAQEAQQAQAGSEAASGRDADAAEPEAGEADTQEDKVSPEA